MSESIKLSILTPERKVFNGEVKELTTENDLGRFEILPGHEYMVTTLTPTVTFFTTVDNKRLKLFTSTGMLKVNNNEVDFLCETAEWPEEIDLARAEEARKKAEHLLVGKEGAEYRKAELKLRRALARIKVKE